MNATPWMKEDGGGVESGFVGMLHRRKCASRRNYSENSLLCTARRTGKKENVFQNKSLKQAVLKSDLPVYHTGGEEKINKCFIESNFTSLDFQMTAPFGIHSLVLFASGVPFVRFLYFYQQSADRLIGGWGSAWGCQLFLCFSRPRYWFHSSVLWFGKLW